MFAFCSFVIKGAFWKYIEEQTNIQWRSKFENIIYNFLSDEFSIFNCTLVKTTLPNWLNENWKPQIMGDKAEVRFLKFSNKNKVESYAIKKLIIFARNCTRRLWLKLTVNHISISLCLSFCFSVSLSLCLFSLSFYLCLSFSLFLSVCLSFPLFLSVCLSFSLFLSVCLSFPLFLSVCLSVSQPIYLPPCLCLFLYLSLSFYKSLVSLSVNSTVFKSVSLLFTKSSKCVFVNWL